MKLNVENYGITELSRSEMSDTSGGWFCLLLLIIGGILIALD